MDNRSPLEVLRQLGYHGGDSIAYMPPIIPDDVSPDILLAFEPHPGYHQLTQYRRYWKLSDVLGSEGESLGMGRGHPLRALCGPDVGNARHHVLRALHPESRMDLQQVAVQHGPVLLDIGHFVYSKTNAQGGSGIVIAHARAKEGRVCLPSDDVMS